jgi:plastocyanin
MEEEHTPHATNQTAIRKRFVALLFALVLVGAAVVITMLISGKKPSETVISTPAPKLVTVQVTKDGFVPASITIEKGSVVEWSSKDSTTSHIIEANPFPTGKDLPDLKSGQMGSGATYRFKFTQAGSFGYHDQLNPTTSGTVVVK